MFTKGTRVGVPLTQERPCSFRRLRVGVYVPRPHTGISSQGQNGPRSACGCGVFFLARFSSITNSAGQMRYLAFFLVISKQGKNTRSVGSFVRCSSELRIRDVYKGKPSHPPSIALLFFVPHPTQTTTSKDSFTVFFLFSLSLFCPFPYFLGQTFLGQV
ncbi:hypothetical protein LY78DRAFT_95985 [Colletotrichum sublineola]|nr:hypothetical protein LY78DRAFT_95985 [Colletotrichum sublineola]